MKYNIMVKIIQFKIIWQSQKWIELNLLRVYDKVNVFM